MSNKKKILSDSSYLFVGQILVMLISLLGTSFLTKNLGSNEYGKYMIVISYVTLFQLFSLSGIQKVFVREVNNGKNSLELVYNKLIPPYLFSLVISFLICNFLVLFLAYSNEIKYNIFIFSFSIFFTGLIFIFQTLLMSEQSFLKLSLISPFQRFFAIISVCMAVFWGLNSSYYFYFRLLMLFFVILFSIYLSQTIIKRIKWKTFGQLPNRSDAMFKSSLIFSLIYISGSFTVNIDAVMLGLLSTPTQVGVYSIGNRLIGMGALAIDSIAVVLFPNIVKNISSDKSLKFFNVKNMFLYSSLLLILLIMGYSVVPYFVEFFFGADFFESIIIFRILLIYLFIKSFTIPIVLILQTLEYEMFILKTQLLKMTLNIPLNFLLFYYFGTLGIAYSTIIVFSLASFYLWYYGIIYINRFKKESVKI